MSAGAVFQTALRFVNRLGLSPEAQRHVVVAMERGRPNLTMLVALGYDSGLAHEPLMARAAGLFLAFCGGNLADDLIDGDCDYMPPRLGPAMQYLIHNASVAALADAEIPSSVIGAAMREFVAAASEEPNELTTTDWNEATYRRIGTAIAARQWVGYLRILWYATPLEPKAEALGLALGMLGHIVEDIRSKDRRFFGMPREDQLALVRWALDTIPAMRAHGLSAVDAMMHTIEPALKHELQNASL